MDILEAYDMVLEKIEELREYIDIEVYRGPFATSLLEKYGNTGLPVDKWVRFDFKIENEIQLLKIKEAGDYLGEAGISFDTGGMIGSRDWEIDWSLSVDEERSQEWIETRESVEEELERLGEDD